MLTFPAGSTGEMRINDIQTLRDNVYFGNRVLFSPGPLTLTDSEGNMASPGFFVINDQTSECMHVLGIYHAQKNPIVLPCLIPEGLTVSFAQSEYMFAEGDDGDVCAQLDGTIAVSTPFTVNFQAEVDTAAVGKSCGCIMPPVSFVIILLLVR